MSDSAALKLHAESIVIDAACPLARDPAYLSWYKEGGVSVAAPTVGGRGNARASLNQLALWQQLLRERDDLLQIRCARDVHAAKQSGRLGVHLHFQGTEPIEDDLDLIDLYKSLGVGVIQLTYNIRNRVGDGCEEHTDAGLSRFGAKLIERLNRARIIVDCSHTGQRTSLDAIECSTAPVVLSHSNVASVHPSARNVSDELIDAVARSGGVIGVVGFPALVANTTTPTLDQFISHIDAIVRIAGIDHVGLGLDYYAWQSGIASDEVAVRGYQEAVRTGIWGEAYPPPPHHYPTGIETPRALPHLTSRLLERGYGEVHIRKILGENWLRVMQRVWG